jgi:large subunit ribosomal protein L25
MEHTLAVHTREDTGKEKAKKLRQQGFIPAVIYGYKGTTKISVKASDFIQMFGEIGEHSIVTLAGDGEKKIQVIVKDFQQDPVKRDIIHVDFLEFEKGKNLRTEIPVHVNGNAAGVKKGGILEVYVTDVEIECFPKDIPDGIPIDVSALEIGDSIHVRDLTVSDKVRILTNPDQVVVSIGMPTKVAKPEEEKEEEELVEEAVAPSIEGESEEEDGQE